MTTLAATIIRGASRLSARALFLNNNQTLLFMASLRD